MPGLAHLEIYREILPAQEVTKVEFAGMPAPSFALAKVPPWTSYMSAHAIVTSAFDA